MGENLTVDQMHALFVSKWVLVGDPETDDALAVQRGKVLWHSTDRDEVYRKAIELRPRRFAVLCTAKMPEGTEIVL